MQHPDEGLIHTWLDGELGADEAASLEAHVDGCPECSARVAEARGLVAASSRIVSALDMVPSGVIPAAAPRRRAWYAGTQFRAAAAVMIVAGASFLVLKNRDTTSMEKVMSVSRDAASSAPSPAPLSAPSSMPTSEASKAVSNEAVSNRVQPAPMISQKNATSPQRERRTSAAAPASPEANDEVALSGKVAGARVERPAVGAIRDSQQQQQQSRVAPVQNLAASGVASGIARGVEGGFAPPELKKVRSDSTQSVIRTVFEVSGGVEVTLVDIPTPVFSQRKMERKAMATAAPPPVASAPQADAAKEKSEVVTISWTDKRGHSMSLTGPLPKEQLELLRKRLPEDQR